MRKDSEVFEVLLKDKVWIGALSPHEVPANLILGNTHLIAFSL